MKIKFNYLLFFCFATLLLTIACKSKPKKAEKKASSVEVYISELQEIPYEYTFVSQTNSKNNFTIEPRINGYLLSKNYKSGNPVKKGELLYEIEQETFIIELSKAKANVASAKASLKKAEANYNRIEPLAQIEAVSKSDLDTAYAELIASREQYNVAVLQLNNAKLQLGYTKIYAPHKGIGSSTTAVVGDYVGVGTKFTVLSTISYIDTISVSLSLPMSKYLNVVAKHSGGYPSFENKDVLKNIKMELSDGTIYPVEGIYDYTNTNVDSDADAIVFKVLFPNKNYTLKAGQFVRVTATIGNTLNMITTPQVSVSYRQNIANVWVVSEDDIISYREVIIGGIYGDDYIITSGLKEGEMIIANGFFKLRNGEKVIPKKI